MMRIVVDVDGVLAAHFKPYAAAVRSERGANLRATDLSTWDIRDGEANVLSTITTRLGDPAYLWPVAGVDRLRDAGHEVVVATHRPATVHPTTRRWLAANDIVVDEYLTDVPDNKGRIDGDVLIDDYHGNVGDALAADMKGLLFRQPWNRRYATDFDADQIVYGWDEIPEAIADL
jgi:5'(3')-deoxyribonucleotidase